MACPRRSRSGFETVVSAKQQAAESNRQTLSETTPHETQTEAAGWVGWDSLEANSAVRPGRHLKDAVSDDKLS